MARKKIGRLSRKNKSLSRIRQESEVNKNPQCFVITRGTVGLDVKRLVQDFRQVMEPNTATRLRQTKKNSVRDFVGVAAQLSVTHLVIFSQTKLGIYIKLVRIPNGPTLTFKILKYSLMKDVLSSQKRPYTPPGMFNFGPCLMTNLQPQEGPLNHQLAARMFLDLFPTITPNKAKTDLIQRCCLIHNDSEDKFSSQTREGSDDEEEDSEGVFTMRHYAIRIVTLGVSRAIRKINKRKLPDLSGFNDVSEFMTRAGAGSESEGEDDPSAHVTVSGKLARARISGAHKSSVRLYEMGPRLSLKLVKIEDGLLEGTTLFHSSITLTDEEKLKLEKKRRVKSQLKMKRKEEQERNVVAKKRKLEAHKRRCMEGTGRVPEAEGDRPEDDAQYYREEVGEEPDQEMFQSGGGVKRKREGHEFYKKKGKKGEDDSDADNTEDKGEFKNMTRKERKEKKTQLGKERRAGIKRPGGKPGNKNPKQSGGKPGSKNPKQSSGEADDKKPAKKKKTGPITEKKLAKRREIKEAAKKKGKGLGKKKAGKKPVGRKSKKF